ncbi:hypothetical protein [Parafrigoribacterium soli]|uniref:hypothetical protein n=1 Tax=Parafrigoribacterium soli TaxID=3144663 RepID=UPI0032F07FFE
MSRFEGLAERGRVLPAVMVAAGILLFTFAAQLVSGMVFYVTALFQGAGYQAGALGAFLSPGFLLVTIAYSVGVFAVIWLFAPLFAALRLGRVIAQSLLAAAGGVVLAFLVYFAMGMLSWLANANFFSNSLGQATDSFFRDGGNAFLVAVSSTLGQGVNVLPLTVLAVVLTWSWLVRHPMFEREAAPSTEV